MGFERSIFTKLKIELFTSTNRAKDILLILRQANELGTDLKREEKGDRKSFFLSVAPEVDI